MKLLLDHITFCTEEYIPVCVYGRDMTVAQRLAIAGALSDALINIKNTLSFPDDVTNCLLEALNISHLSSSNPEVHIHLILKCLNQKLNHAN
jgi:hypothetical protein